MSKQIDERVVSMEFDNRQFEKNVQTSLSTLDKLKQKLNLDGASKGLDNVGSAAKKVNLSSLGNSIETVRSKFSALEVMGVTALANITNSAVNAGKRFVSSLTVAPVKDGFQEYEMTLNAVQTTMAGTGKTAKEVEKELKKLDEYADKTVYSTSDMLNNLPKFTNAGVELEKATTAMIGIANATALAGGDARQASIAFYNLGQSIGTGYLTRIDYNSINNAGIATMEWKNQMIEAAIAQGTLTKTGEDAYVAGNKTYTLQQLFIDGLQEQWATASVLTKVFGDYGDETTEIGKKAFSAAKDVKTFTQMMESLKATAGTGWKDTWQLIFGDLDKAKEFWTKINNFIGGIIEKTSDFRNKVLGGALGNPFQSFLDKLDNSSLGKTVEAVTNLANGLEYYQKVVDDVWRGDYKNSDTGRFELLEKAGYNHKVIQDLVNKGYDYKLTMEDVAESEKKFGVNLSETSEEIKNTSSSLENLSDEQLKNAGLTDEEIKMYRELEEQSKKTGKSIKELVDEMSTRDGRTLLIETFENVGKSIVTIIKSIKEAWTDIFPPMTSIQLYNIIKSLNEFSQKLKVNDKMADNLKLTFKGLFAILDIILTVIGGPIKIVFKLLTQLLAAFDLNILDVTASIGDAIVRFRDWIDSTLDFTKIFEKIVPVVKNAIKVIKELVSAIKDSEFYKTGKNILQGLINGLKNGAQSVWEVIVNIGKTIVEKIKGVLGIHSPSTVFFEIGSNIIQGLINGIQNGASNVWETIKKVGSKCIEIAQKIDWGAVFSGGAIGGSLLIANKFANALEAFSGPFEGLGEVFSGVGKVLNKSAKGIGKILNNTAKVVKSFSKIMNSIAFNIKTKGIRNLAISLLILVGAIAILTLIDTDKLKAAATTIVILAGVLVALSLAAEKMSKASVSIDKKGAKMDGLKNGLLSIATALLLVALTVKIIGSMDPEKAKQGFIGLAGMMIGIGLLFKACNKVGKTDNGNVDNIGKTILKISIAMILMVLVIKLISKMDAESLFKGILVITLFSGIIAGLIAATKLAGKDIDNIGSTILKISASMILLALVLKMVGGMDADKLSSGLKTITAFAGIITVLILVTRLAGNKINNIGKTILAVSSAIMMLALVVRLMGGMETSKMAKGMIAVMILSQIIKSLIKSIGMAEKDLVGVGSTILMVSVAIGVLALIATLLGFLSLEHLAKGITAVGILSIMMAGLIKATRGAKNCKDNLIVMTVAIALLAAAVIGLSFIDPKRLATASGALSMVMGAFALLIAATKLAKNTKSMRKTLIQMLGVVAALSSIVAVLSLLDPNSVLPNTFALSLLLISFATSMALLGKVSKISKTVTKNLVYMLAVVAGLAIILGTMSALNVTASLQSAVALSVLLNSMAASLIILSKVGKISKTAISAIQTMTIVIGGLAIILGLMSFFNVTASLQTVLALSLLLNAMAVAMVILDKAGNVSKSAIGSLAIMGLVVGELAIILGLMSVFNIAPSIETAAALSILLLGLSVACLVASNIPISGAVAGAIGLVAFVGIITALLAALGGLSKIPGFNELIKDGGETLALIGYAIGNFVGSIVGGFAAGATSGLPEIGAQLSQFMTNVTPFIEGVKTIDESVFTGVGILSAAILALTAAELINGVVSFLTGGASFAELGTQLSQFMINAIPFIAAASMLDANMMSGVKALADTVLILTAANVLDGLTSWLTGGNSLEKFSEQLPVVGKGLREFLTELGTFSDAEVTTVNCAANAVKKLAEVAASIPNTGGLLASIVGDNDLGPFASQFPVLGSGIRGFLTNVGTFTEEEVATVNCAADAVKLLAEASKEIPNSGGWLAQIVGDNELDKFSNSFPILGTGLRGFLDNVGTFSTDEVATVEAASGAVKTLASSAREIPNTGGLLADIVGDNGLGNFASQFPKLGIGLSGFLENVGTFTNQQCATVSTASNAVKSIASVAKEIPNSGGLIASIVGDNDLGTFASQFPKVGEGLKGFSDNLGTFNDDQVATVNSGIEAVKALTDLANINIDDFKSVTNTFSESIVSVGTKLSEFCEKLASIGGSTITTAIYNTKRIIDLIENMADVDVSGAKKFEEALSSIGRNGINKFIIATTSGISIVKVKNAGTKILNNFIIGVKSKASSALSAFSTIISNILSSIRTKYSSFHGAGTNMAAGFAAGIKDSTWWVALKAKAMAQAAVDAAREQLDENSPSRVFYGIGEYAGEGLVNALEDYASKVYTAGSKVGSEATAGLKNAISKISDVVNSDIDSQPTIRPILDLSEVTAGANSINSMLSLNPSMGVLSNVGSISAMMNSRQNGANNDVVSAIENLGRRLGNGGDTYNINGVTYDDGSNVSNAVQALIRAARIERRT